MAKLKPMQLLLLLGVLMWLGVQWTHVAVSPAASEAHVSTVLTTSSGSSSLRSYSTSSSDPSSTQSTPDEQQVRSGCQLQLQQKAQAVLDSCPGLPGYCPRPAQMQKQRKAAVLKSQGPQNAQMAQQKTAVDQFLAGPGFQERLEQLQQLPDKRGILISAGKSHHVGNTAIILHALRKQYGCTLPVEIAYRGDKEIDAVTRETLEREFAPLHWLDLNKQQYPAHHFSGYTMDRYEPKIYALYHSRFQQVLMLDADNLPARDPSYLFDSAHALQHGAMFWLDFWSPHLSSTTFIGHNSVYTLLGINKEQYLEVLSSGQGWLHRAAESGQMVLDRVRHADVLEYLWWLTSFSNVLYKHVLGDKDTFGFAFAMAGKLHEMYAVAVPPAAAFKYEGTHWHFHAMVQYDHLGQVAFLHRTFEKWNNVTQPPQIVDVVSGPLPNRFILNYMGNRTRALSPDIPNHAMRPVGITCPAPAAKFVVGAQHNGSFDHVDGTGYAAAPSQGMFGGCPLSLFLQYRQVQELSLPVTRQPRLETACANTLQQLQAANQPHGTAQVGRGGMTAAAAAYGKDGEAARSVSQGLPRPLKATAVAPSRAGMRRQLLVGLGDAGKQQLPQPRESGVQRMRTLQADLSSSTTTDLHVSPGQVAQPKGSECTGQDASLWGQVDEAVWMRACMAQRAAVQHSDSQGQLQQQRQGNHIDEQQAGRSVVRAVAAAQEMITGNATASVSNLQQGLPECGAVEWSVARYVLHEYADAVAVGPDGKLLFDSDPQLPVLQLAKSVSTSAAKQKEGLQDQSPHVQQQSPCYLLQGAVSPVDRLQLGVIPAARDWVLQHLDRLPALTAGKS